MSDARPLSVDLIGKLMLLYVNASSQLVWNQTVVRVFALKVDRNRGEFDACQDAQRNIVALTRTLRRIEALMWPGWELTKPIEVALDLIEREMADDSNRTDVR